MAPVRMPAQHQSLPTTGSSLAVRHGVQHTRCTAITRELNRTFADIRSTAALYNEHLSKMHNQIHNLSAEHTKTSEEKDAAIAELKREVGELKAENKDLSFALDEESDNRKLAVACAESLAKQLVVQEKEVGKLRKNVAELERELTQEKAKATADKGVKERLRSITEKCAEIARLVEDLR